MRQSIDVSSIVGRSDLVFQNLIKRLRIASVCNLIRNVAAAASDRKTVDAVVGFGPPTVENRKIQSAVEDNFLATRPRGF